MAPDKFIGFNEVYLSGKEAAFVTDAVSRGSISGDGIYSEKCEEFFRQKYGFRCALLTTSCTHALEMAALLLDIQPGDEVILPSFTYVSTANAFALRGAKLRFADSLSWHPDVDPDAVAQLITSRTKAIVPVHYAGMACDMKKIMGMATTDISVVEDAAQCINATYYGAPLGTFGRVSAFSFHETKNITAGTGGMLVVNDESLIERAEVIRNKGTNKAAFTRGEVSKYSWAGLGSSYAPNEISSAFLFAQVGDIERVQQKRQEIWAMYYDLLQPLAGFGIQLPVVPEGAGNNAHIFYLVCETPEMRTRLIGYLAERNIQAVFHYQSLHASPYFRSQHDGRILKNSDRYSDCLVRLPLHYNLTAENVQRVCSSLLEFVTRL